MKVRHVCLSLFSLLAALSMVGCGLLGQKSNLDSAQNTSPTNSGINSVNHVIIMVQENRSFDHYFGHLNDYRVTLGLPQDVDGTPAGASNPNFDGTANIAAFHLVTACTEDLSSFWNESHIAWNLQDPTSPTPLMNGFAHAAGNFARDENQKGNGPYTDIEGVRAMGYYAADDFNFYYFMASQFATSDRWFSPVMTRTQPNRMYLLAATSQGHVYPPSTVLTAPTIFALLDKAGVSWKIYVTDPNGTYLTYFQPYASQHMANIVPAAQFATDAQNGTLPAVTLIESGYESGRDEHPTNNVQDGQAYAASFINSLMQSPSWKDSVFFLTWDEGGGFYDHVPPVAAVNPDGIAPIDLQSGDIPGNFDHTGFRVPLIVISPLAKKGYVSHTPADYTAMLKFIEKRWGLPSLTLRDAQQMDMTEFLDASAPNLNPPMPPTPASALPCTPSHMQ